MERYPDLLGVFDAEEWRCGWDDMHLLVVP